MAFGLSSIPQKALQQGLPQQAGSSPMPMQSEQPPLIQPQQFGGIEGINKSLGSTQINPQGLGTQTQSNNWSPDVKAKMGQEVQQSTTPQPQQAPASSTYPSQAPSSDINKGLSDLTDQMTQGIQAGKTINIDKLKSAYPEFSGVDNSVLQELTNQMSEGIKAGKTLNMDKLMQAYPELSAGGQQEQGITGQPQAFSNLQAGALASATAIPRFVANKLADSVGWIANQLGADPKKVQSLVDSYKQYISEDQLAKEFNTTTSNPLFRTAKTVGDIAQIGVGGEGIAKGVAAGAAKLGIEGASTASKVGLAAAKGAAIGAGTTQLQSIVSKGQTAGVGETLGGAALGGAIGAGIEGYQALKAVGKEGINPLLQEKLTARNIRTASDQGRYIEPEQSTLAKTKIGGTPITTPKTAEILPTKKVIQADNILKQEMPNYDKASPMQIRSFIKSDIANTSNEIHGSLVQTPIDSSTSKQMRKVASQIKTELSDSSIVRSSTEKASLKQVVKDMQNAKNMDDVWKARINYDAAQADSVVKPNGPMDAITAAKHDNRMTTRSKINDILDNSTKNISDINVKSKFNRMSSLYNADDIVRQNLPTSEAAKPLAGWLSKQNITKGLIKLGVGATVIGGADYGLRRLGL